jgi:diguanylate cyclase (GGDEF)-like protein
VTESSSIRILLAEDDPTQRLGLTHELGRAGYTVDSVSDGEEALTRLLSGSYHVLITDWDMPGMDGKTLCQRVRKASLTGYVYILMLTGRTDVSDLVIGIEAGADDYIRKPADRTELLAKIKAGCRIVALEREVLRLSITDALTGVFNRRYLMDQLPREIDRACRYQRALALVVADLDHFKQINDRQGHAFGDQALRDFAHRTQRLLRASDWIARWGGEEFVFVLPETPLALAVEVAEKIRRECASTPISVGSAEISVTASFGVTALKYLPGSEDCADQLLRRADRAMYISKAAGRNRVNVVADS